MQLVLAAAFILGGEAGYQQQRQNIASSVESLATNAVRTAAGGVPQALAAAEPAGVTFGAVRTTTVTLKILATTLLAAGTPGLATALTVRRDALGGPLDHVGLVVNNAAILDLRVALSATLGIGGGSPPWFPAHPCLLFGSTPIAAPGIPIPTLPGGAPAATPFVDFIHGFVNESGMLQIDLRIRAVVALSLATVTTNATVTAPVRCLCRRGATHVRSRGSEHRRQLRREHKPVALHRGRHLRQRVRSP